MDRRRATELLHEAEWRKCADDPRYFAEKFWHIQTVHGAQVPLLREPQLETLARLQDDGNVIILKARQIGYTTLCALYAFWLAYFHPDKVIIFLSKGEREAKVILKMCKYGHARMPLWMRERGPKKTADNQTEMPFDNGSSIESLPSKEDPARGRTVNLVIVDEWAFLDDPENAWASIEPIADLGGKIVGLSTAKGSGNFFHRLWNEAVALINGFRPLFYSWRAVPERDDAWYEAKRRSMQDWQLHQEYPSTPEEAFIKSGNPVFDVDALRARQLDDPNYGFLWRNPISKRAPEFRKLGEGALGIFQLPQITDVYVVGADVAEGLEYGDYSSAHVLSVSTGSVVAVWHGHLPADEFGDVLYDLGWFYGSALVGCEVNNHGLTTVTRLRNLSYPRIYYRHVYDERTKKKSRKMGWYTSKVTRPLMIDELAGELRADMGIRDKGTLGELVTFVRDDKGKMHGSPHDDRVISLAIANQMRKHATSPEYRVGQRDAPEGSFAWWEKQLESGVEPGRIGAHNMRS